MRSANTPRTAGEELGERDELLELGQAFVRVQADWRITQMNRAAEELSGRRREDAVGRVLWDVWPEASTPDSDAWRAYHLAMEERVPVSCDAYHRSLDRWTAQDIHPTSDGGIVVFCRDVTRLRRAEQAARDGERDAHQRAAEAEAVLESVADALAVYDAEGRVLHSNAVFDRLLGFDAAERAMPAAERVTRGTVEWWSEDGRRLAAEDLPSIRAARYGETHRAVRIRIRGPLGERWLTVSAGPIRLGDTRAGAVISIRDITEAKRAEEMALQSAEELRTLADAMPQLVWTSRPDGSAEYHNQQWCRYTGIALQDAQEEGAWARALHPEDVSRTLERWHRSLQRGEPYEAEYRLRRASDGAYRWFLARAIPMREATGRLVRWFGTATDIHDHKRAVSDLERAQAALRESEETFRSVFQQAAVGMGRVRFEDARWIDVNEALCRMLGRSREEMLRTPWPEMTHPEDLDADLVPFRRMAAGELDSYTVEKRFLHADGRAVWTSLTLSLVRDANGRPDYEVAIVEDVTDRMYAERELRLSRSRLEEADRRKDEFLGMLSHELRNPLAPIRNALYILDHAEPAGQQARRAKDIATRQVAHLTRLVDDLLDVTRIARGKIELRHEDLDLGALVRRTAEDYRALLQDRGLDLAVDVPEGPLLVNGDPARLTQVFGNLLNNAAKFTPAGGRVSLSVRAEGDRVVVHVMDTGPGIASDLLPTLFEPFTQGAQTLARSEGGLGLGLSLVQGLVALHGGEVAVSNREEGGADFVVAFSLARPAAAAARGALAPAAADRGPRHRVLVVDDNRDAAQSLGELVEMLGHDVELAYDGPSAVAQADRSHPDLVLCDIGLPGMDGYQVARELRARLEGAVRLVALSGYAQPEDVARAIESGFDKHVAKPPDPGKLEGLLA